MTIIPPIPSFILTAMQTYLQPLMAWFSAEVYKQLLDRAPQEMLVQVQKQLDCGPLERACAGYLHTSGPGAPAVHTVSRLVRALLVKYLLNLSLRGLEHAIRWNLLVKWFVGYAVFETGPDHATLERFEQWVCREQQRTFFDEVLKQIDQRFPEERSKAQMGDTYALRANATAESLIQLIRHSCQALLREVEQVDKSALTQVTSQLDRSAFWDAEGELKDYRLEKAQRSQRLQKTVIAAVHCQQLIRALWHDQDPAVLSLEWQGVVGWLTRLDKILADEVTITYDPQGQITQVKELPKKQKGTYRIGSATDPDATYRVHDEQCDFGYNVNLATTDTFIREIQANTGCQPDPVGIAGLLQAQQHHHGMIPDKFIYDMAAGTGKWHALVAFTTNNQTQLVAPLRTYDTSTKRFGPDDFTLSPDGHTLTCPHGQVSTKAYRSQGSEGFNFRFFPSQCQDCPLVSQCRTDNSIKHLRQVFISDHRSALALARTYALTPNFQADLKLRAAIERIIANLVRYHNSRYAQTRGTIKCDYQVKMNAMSFNLRQWIRQLNQTTKTLSPSAPA